MSTIEKATVQPRVVLVGLQLPGSGDAEHKASLAELGRLVQTLGFKVIATVSQKRASPVTATVVGEGKLAEIARLTGGTGKVAPKAPAPKRPKSPRPVEAATAEDEADDEIDLPDDLTPVVSETADKVVFDNELTPNQLRNLETALGVEVLDRTGVIVEIFHRHARTREARAQVEIARLKYLAPRLRQARTGGDRSGGGIGAKGVGETAHELDRRRIRDRIAELTRDLAEIRQSQEERRSRRREHHKVALVGYTNAGKSSLMRKLTGSDVLVEDKLFATLDTTIRVMHPETTPKILVSDTVGFIKKLPHDLVASFRSTLDEAADASLLLFVVDASDPTFRSQLQVTRDVLAEIGANDAPTTLVLNKCDLIDAATLDRLRVEFPEGVQLSTRRPADVQRLRNLILGYFERDMKDVELHVPYARGELVGEIRRTLRVLAESHDEHGTTLKVKGPDETIAKITKALADA